MKWMLTMKLFLFLAVFSQLSAAFDGFLFEEDHGVEMLPNNPKVCTGGNITLTCTSTDVSNFNSSHLSFSVNGEHVEQSEKQVLNESSAAMTFWNTQPNRHESICCKNGEQLTVTDGECQTVLTYDYPVPVANLMCVVNDWSQSMNCTWKPGTDYVIKPKVTFEWRVRHALCNWNDCSDFSYDYNYCHWNSTLVGVFMRVIDIRMAVEAKCGITKTNYYTINTKTVVKPAAPTDLRSEVLNSTCVRVTWTATRLEYRKIYEAWHTSKWEKSQSIVIDGNTTGMEKNNEVVFCGLIPATSYTFHVRVKPAKKYWSSPDDIHTSCENCSSCSNTRDAECECLTNDGYWSDERTINEMTYGDVPGASPEVSPGGYKWDPNDCKGEGGRRTVSVYWQPLNDTDKNGVILGYDVKLHSDTDGEIGANVAGDTTFETFENILCNSGYTVAVKARNSNGTSPNVSTLRILDSKEGIYPPEFLVEMSNVTDTQGKRTVHVEWTHVDRQDVTGYTVYSCKKEQGECAIRSVPTWGSFGTEVNSTVLELMSPEDFMYGVSVDTEIGSSGITWQSCIYTKDVAPKSPSGVEVRADEDRALYVNWERLTCASGQPYVNLYVVEYCQDNNCDRQETKDNSVILHDLEEDMVYRIRVQGVTMAGEAGPWSEPTVEAKPIDKSLKPGEIAGIAIACLFVLAVFLAVGIFIFRRWCRKVKQKFTPRKVENILQGLEAPGIDNEHYIGDDSEPTGSINKGRQGSHGYVSQTSVESGYEEGHTGSPDSSPTNGNKFFSSSIEEESEEDVKKEQQMHLQQIISEGYVRATVPPNLDPHVVVDSFGPRGPVGHVQPPGHVHVGFVLNAIPVPKGFQNTMTMDHEEDKIQRDIQATVENPKATDSGSVSPYMVAAIGSSIGPGSGTGNSFIQNENTPVTHTSNQNTTMFAVSGTGNDSYVTITRSMGIESNSGVQEDYQDNVEGTVNSENAEQEEQVSDYQTMATIENVAFDPDASDQEEPPQGFGLAAEECHTTNQNTDETMDIMESESNQQSENSRESYDGSAYLRFIPGDKTESLKTDDTHKNKTEMSMLEQQDGASAGDSQTGYVSEPLANIMPDINSTLGASEPSEQEETPSEATDCIPERQAGTTKATAGYITQDTAEKMAQNPGIPNTAAGNANGYVSEHFAHGSSPAGSESSSPRSSLNDVEMSQQYVDESPDCLSQLHENASVSTGYVSEPFADALNRYSETGESEGPPSDDHESPTLSLSDLSDSGHGLTMGYVSQELANVLGNDNSSERNGYVSQELPEAMSLPAKKQETNTDNNVLSNDVLEQDSSPDIIKADRNGNVDKPAFEYVENPTQTDQTALNETSGNTQTLTQLTANNPPVTQGNTTNGYVSPQFAEELFKSGLREQRDEKLNNNTESQDSGKTRAMANA